MQRTLAILKPDCVRKNLIGEVTTHIQKAGFKIVAMKMLKLNKTTAGEFYAVHKGRPFYDDLVKFMTSSPVVPILLEKENAVADLRTLIGATDPAKADCGTLRQEIALDVQKNSVHASDSAENAAIETAFFFD